MEIKFGDLAPANEELEARIDSVARFIRDADAELAETLFNVRHLLGDGRVSEASCLIGDRLIGRLAALAMDVAMMNYANGAASRPGGGE